MLSLLIPLNVFAHNWMSYLFYPGVVIVFIYEITIQIKTFDKSVGKQNDRGTQAIMTIASALFFLISFVLAHFEIGRMSNVASYFGFILAPAGYLLRIWSIETLGKFFTVNVKVQKDQKIFVHRLEAEEGTEMNFDKILLVDNDGKITIGSPTVENAKVTAKVLDHVKGDKVFIFKKKRRKGYKLKNGHRQQFTQIQIAEIVA